VGYQAAYCSGEGLPRPLQRQPGLLQGGG